MLDYGRWALRWLAQNGRDHAVKRSETLSAQRRWRYLRDDCLLRSTLEWPTETSWIVSKNSHSQSGPKKVLGVLGVMYHNSYHMYHELL